MKMRGVSWIGLALLAAVFALSVTRQVTRARRDTAGGRIVIRLAHAQLEPGMREAFDAAARDYTALHPGVLVEQIAVPRRAWEAWMQTQLIGGTAPDLLQLVNNDPNPILRHFLPVNEAMAEPNPYNAGTDLEGVPWRDTFIGPLLEPPTYWPWYLNTYGVPTTVFTPRLYYNRRLLREITGADDPPRTFDDFIALCRRVRARSAESGREVHPIAGARPVPPNDMLFMRLMRNQAQTLTPAVDRTRSLGGGTATGDLRGFARDAAFDGVWSLRSPEIQSGFALVREVGQYFQPGFLQATRDEAMFYFLQERALMIMSGSWEYQAITGQANFPTGAFRLPEPERGHPQFGRFVLGPASEAGTSMRGAFAVTKQSQHPEVAIDFLQFLTSKGAHAKFARLSGWLPVVRGVEPVEALRPFYPALDGYPEGFFWAVGVETVRLWESYVHLLFGSPDGVERLTAELEPRFAAALVVDEIKETRESVNIITSYDARAMADFALRRAGAAPLFTDAKRSELFEAQTYQENLLIRSRTVRARSP
jgi:raffinose/stachyose/melibiose transport system substrate-binding protein